MFWSQELKLMYFLGFVEKYKQELLNLFSGNIYWLNCGSAKCIKYTWKFIISEIRLSKHYRLGLSIEYIFSKIWNINIISFCQVFAQLVIVILFRLFNFGLIKEDRYVNKLSFSNVMQFKGQWKNGKIQKLLA